MSGIRDKVLVFDTANEAIAIGLGRLDATTRSIPLIADRELKAHRASNTQLLPQIETMLAEAGIARDAIAALGCGRGPGSFTGVRIALATAKGLALGLDVALIGLSTLEAVAWVVWETGLRGPLRVVADAMRHEVYPGLFQLTDAGVERVDDDHVVKIETYLEQTPAGDTPMVGDGLYKYQAELAEKGRVLDETLWAPTGRGLLLALEAAWRADSVDPFDRRRHEPATVLPIYTRLSDAEEHERARLSRDDQRDLESGVDGPEPNGRTPQDEDVEIRLRLLTADDCEIVAGLEQQLLPYSAWTAAMVGDELGRGDRSWWVAVARDRADDPADAEETILGYAGARIADGAMELLKVAVVKPWRRRGIAKALIARLAEDSRNLGADKVLLEVRADNADAIALYEALGLAVISERRGYYGDADATIMEGPLPEPVGDVAGMTLTVEGLHDCDRTAGAEHQSDEGRRCESPLLLAIETSCDETAAAIVDGADDVLANAVASQVDFHARFGGVVPEIASRKHIEAICGVTEAALATANVALESLDAIAVTAAPGLVGALVVGVAFAKGLAFALEKPLIAVNHLEGHLYANKLADPSFGPPAVASLVSGGHTLLVFMRDWGDYETLGTTIDDAVGEAFDKVAKALGLDYPGGPAIGRLAEAGDPDAIAFPRAMLHSGDLRFSLSGLKTAVLTYLEKERAAGRTPNKADVAASFQAAVIDVQIAKAEQALEQTGAATLALGGGVAANGALRAAYESLARRLGITLVMSPRALCGDNAAMIGLVAVDRYRAGAFAPLTLDAAAHADLDESY